MNCLSVRKLKHENKSRKNKRCAKFDGIKVIKGGTHLDLSVRYYYYVCVMKYDEFWLIKTYFCNQQICLRNEKVDIVLKIS